MYNHLTPMTPLEEVHFWATFGYPTEGMIFCMDCYKYHEANCQGVTKS